MSSELATLALRLAGGDRDTARGLLAGAIDEIAAMIIAEAAGRAAGREERAGT